jgi:hypothetical protein
MGVLIRRSRRTPKVNPKCVILQSGGGFVGPVPQVLTALTCDEPRCQPVPDFDRILGDIGIRIL